MRSFVSCLLLFISIPVSAQTTAPAPSSLSEQIVVTASALPEKAQETPAAVTVITRDVIERLDVRDAGEALRFVPGLFVARSGSSGKATALFTRGANSNQTLVLWNGIEIVNPAFGGYDFGQFSTNGVEQIEIVRGPFSALYGADAAAGVVNVISTPSRAETRASIEGGSHGLRNANVMLARTSGNLVASGAFESTRDDGFAPNDFFRRNSGNGMLRWSFASGSSIGIVARHLSYSLGIPTNLSGDLLSIVPSPEREQRGTETEVGAPFDVQTGAITWSGIVAEARRDDRFSDPEDAFGFVSSLTRTSTRRARLTGRITTVIGTLVAGGEYERAVVDDASNFGVTLDNSRRTERSFFFEDRYTRATANGAFDLSAGVRRDRYTKYGSETSPRLAVAFRTGANRLRAAYGEAFRAPSVSELFSPFGGDPTLQAERTSSTEVGYDHFFGRGAQFSVTAFHSAFRDLITNSGFVYRNVGHARSNGVEVGLQRDFASGVYTALSYTYTATKQDESGLALLRRPRNSATAILGTRRGAVDMNVDIVYAGSRADIIPVLPFSRTNVGAWSTVDLNVRYHVGNVVPYVKVENATNRKYEEILGFPSPTRRAIVGVRFAM
jgi:vitamin B12 transporter